jgi:hypothetical protein
MWMREQKMGEAEGNVFRRYLESTKQPTFCA